MKRYRLLYLDDFDDGCPTHFDSPSAVEAGDVIGASNGFHHHVLGIEAATSPEPVLVLGKSGQGPLDAIAQTLHPPPS